MDVAEVEENLFAISDAKLHGDMCRTLSALYCKILSIFPTLEKARPRSTSGIQALCSLHIALEKAKNILRHCSECSILYLAITGDSILLKFNRAKSSLIDSLQRIEDIVPQSIACQIQVIVSELEGTVFSLDSSEKQIGDEIIALLQQGLNLDSGNGKNELESFHQAVTKLGITSSRAALTERRALKKLIERAKEKEDKRKDSIVAYLLHLMRKYSKLFRTEISDDFESQGSSPRSPAVQDCSHCGSPGGNSQSFDQQVSKIRSFNFNVRTKESGQMALPPEELRCPISLQLMYDPVIIASGQTYDRVCIEKWFSDGHNSCPKTQQKLPHLSLTPNYCVKGMVASWCEQNGVPVPDGPPESLDLNYWRLDLSESESTNTGSAESVVSENLKEVKVVPLEENGPIVQKNQESGPTEGFEENETENVPVHEEDSKLNIFERYEDFLHILNGEEDFRKKSKVVVQIRFLLKDDEEARNFMGNNGFVEALLQFLTLAVHEEDVAAQEVGAMALFNLAVNNDRNKEAMLGTGVTELLEKMISNSESHGPAAALYLNVTCLEKAKPVVGLTEAVPFLIKCLQDKSQPQIKSDSLHSLYNLSSHPSNIPKLLESGIIPGLQSLLAVHGDHPWTDKCIAILVHLASSELGKDKMASTPSLLSVLALILDAGKPLEQEQAAACLLILCTGNERCCQLLLKEGVIPALVSISVNGTMRGKDKSQKLLMLFRKQRQQEQAPADGIPGQGQPDEHKADSKVQTGANSVAQRRANLRCQSKADFRTGPSDMAMLAQESKPLTKSASVRKVGRQFFNFLFKSKRYFFPN